MLEGERAEGKWGIKVQNENKKGNGKETSGIEGGRKRAEEKEGGG